MSLTERFLRFFSFFACLKVAGILPATCSESLLMTWISAVALETLPAASVAVTVSVKVPPFEYTCRIGHAELGDGLVGRRLVAEAHAQRGDAVRVPGDRQQDRRVTGGDPRRPRTR